MTQQIKKPLREDIQQLVYTMQDLVFRHPDVIPVLFMSVLNAFRGKLTPEQDEKAGIFHNSL